MGSAVLTDAISAQTKRFRRGEEQLRGRNKRRMHKIRCPEKRQPQEGEKDASGKWGGSQHCVQLPRWASGLILFVRQQNRHRETQG